VLKKPKEKCQNALCLTSIHVSISYIQIYFTHKPLSRLNIIRPTPNNTQIFLSVRPHHTTIVAETQTEILSLIHAVV